MEAYLDRRSMPQSVSASGAPTHQTQVHRHSSVFVFGIGAGHSQVPDYTSLRSSGRAEYSAGNFERAETLLRNALEIAQRSKDDLTVATAEDDLGDVYTSEERLIEAERSYSRALAIFRRLPDRTYETA